jgi:hypothetical protein
MLQVVPEISDADALLIEAALEGNIPEGEDLERLGQQGFIKRAGRCANILEWKNRPKNEPVEVSEWARVALAHYIDRTLPNSIRRQIIKIAQHQALRMRAKREFYENEPSVREGLAHRRMRWLLARKHEAVAKDWDNLVNAMEIYRLKEEQ